MERFAESGWRMFLTMLSVFYRQEAGLNNEDLVNRQHKYTNTWTYVLMLCNAEAFFYIQLISS